jgi:hypothetical protein
MKKLFLVVVWLAWADVASAQIPSCGAINTKTDIWDNTFWSLYLDGYSQSTRNLDGCIEKMRVEAWIWGTTSGVKTAESYGMAASVFYSERVSQPGDWTAQGKHWLITIAGWIWNGYSSDTARITYKSDPEPDPAADCAAQGAEYYWDGGTCQYTPGSPILVDVGRNGYHLTNVADGVRFDLDGDGIAEQVAWTAVDSDDAFLAMDRNGNGVIDNGSELFGNATPAFAGQTDLRARNGFEALGFLEGPDYGVSYTDANLSARDAMFGRLLLWADSNHNGISEPEELRSLAAAGLTSIGTAYTVKKRVDGSGNQFRQKGSLVWADGSIDTVYDVWLQRER